MGESWIYWGSVSPSVNGNSVNYKWDVVSKYQRSATIYLLEDQLIVTSLPTPTVDIVRNLLATRRGKQRWARLPSHPPFFLTVWLEE